MRRDTFDVDVRNVPGARDGDDRTDEDGAADPPVLAITYEGKPGRLADRLAGDLGSDDLDVTYRSTAGDRPGVLSIADRLTGEFLVETDLDVDRLGALVDAVPGTDGDDDRYRLEITDATGAATVVDQRTLLVYDADGGLRRGDSLIPGSVEL